MLRNLYFGDALYVAWKLDTTRGATPNDAYATLVDGEKRKLYHLRSWVVADGEAHALVTPEAPLEQIAEAIWKDAAAPIGATWIESGSHMPPNPGFANGNARAVNSSEVIRCRP